MDIPFSKYLPNPGLGGAKNKIFLKIGSRIRESAKNDLEIPYKYISDYLGLLKSGLEAFFYDFQKMIFDLTRLSRSSWGDIGCNSISIPL